MAAKRIELHMHPNNVVSLMLPQGSQSRTKDGRLMSEIVLFAEEAEQIRDWLIANLDMTNHVPAWHKSLRLAFPDSVLDDMGAKLNIIDRNHATLEIANLNITIAITVSPDLDYSAGYLRADGSIDKLAQLTAYSKGFYDTLAAVQEAIQQRAFLLADDTKEA